MKEKEIIKGNLKSSKTFKRIFGLVCLIVLVVFLILSFNAVPDEKTYYSRCNDLSTELFFDFGCDRDYSFLREWFEIGYGFCALVIIGIYALVILYVKFVWDPIELTVTNKRVYGIAAFGKRVDLPLDSISSIGIIKLFKGVSIATSSGRISFCFITNHKEVYNAISELLVERQNNKNSKSSNANLDYIEELKKLKELMNEGIITQEEFDKKKNELLN